MKKRNYIMSRLEKWIKNWDFKTYPNIILTEEEAKEVLWLIECREKRRKHVNDLYQQNKEAKAARQKADYEANPEKYKERNHKAYEHRKLREAMHCDE